MINSKLSALQEDVLSLLASGPATFDELLRTLYDCDEDQTRRVLARSLGSLKYRGLIMEVGGVFFRSESSTPLVDLIEELESIVSRILPKDDVPWQVVTDKESASLKEVVRKFREVV